MHQARYHQPVEVGEHALEGLGGIRRLLRQRADQFPWTKAGAPDRAGLQALAVVRNPLDEPVPGSPERLGIHDDETTQAASPRASSTRSRRQPAPGSAPRAVGEAAHDVDGSLVDPVEGMLLEAPAERARRRLVHAEEREARLLP